MDALALPEISSDGTPVTFSPIGSRHRDLCGEKFGVLTAVGYWGRSKGTSLWWCRCECGSLFRYSLANLASGRSTGCRLCVYKRQSGNHAKATTHPLYTFWLHWKACMADRWMESFWGFVEDVGERPGRMHIVRKVRTALLGPGNFEWSPTVEYRNSTLYEWNGIALTVKQWCKRLGISRQRFHQRLDKGYQGARLFKPSRRSEMPEALNDFAFKTPKYDFTKFADGQIWKFTHKVDFQQSPQAFGNIARQYAARNSKRVRVRLFDDAVVLQFLPVVLNGEQVQKA
jgi:hypothetical protein